VGKTKRSDKEFTREQRLAKENRELKRELSHLRKQITRLDGDRFEDLRQMVADQEENQKFQENMGPVSSSLETLKRDWACRKCDGYLEINLYPKMGQTFYYRACNKCRHRTTGKRYDAAVKGILKNSQ
jgi:uncharacterized protein with von Willebrand factor type A (vWA) domain